MIEIDVRLNHCGKSSKAIINLCVYVYLCVSMSAIPRGFLAAVAVAVRVDVAVRTDVVVLLAAVVAVPFLVVAVEPV